MGQGWLVRTAANGRLEWSGMELAPTARRLPSDRIVPPCTAVRGASGGPGGPGGPGITCQDVPSSVATYGATGTAYPRPQRFLPSLASCVIWPGPPRTSPVAHAWPSQRTAKGCLVRMPPLSHEYPAAQASPLPSTAISDSCIDLPSTPGTGTRCHCWPSQRSASGSLRCPCTRPTAHTSRGDAPAIPDNDQKAATAGMGRSCHPEPSQRCTVPLACGYPRPGANPALHPPAAAAR